ncbi:MAG: type II secretion system major pseudopilin GspG [Pseudomonadota bacterium]
MVRKHARDKTREAGFSLTELLVALAILALIMGVAAPRIIGYLGSSKSKTAQIQIEQFESALELYLLDVGRYPTAEEGLDALVSNVADAPFWAGPYIDKRAAPLDPWGRAYAYDPAGAAGPTVYSLGADGAAGGEGEDADVYPG